VRRRAFIAALGSALVRPTPGRAQRADRIKRIGILIEYGEADAEAQSRMDGLSQGLRALGWSNGSNLQKFPRSVICDSIRAHRPWHL
jgi:hypothetical protein